ncbi:hypothetical protein [Roseovarius sp.]|uniref:hypothetical protein n=1 Tax=Roseovarius sp. TaxID=1486281 RepID=UPI003B591F29
MTPEELTARLADIRIPESFARFGLHDALAAAALGLIAGLLIARLARVATIRKTRPAETARAAIAELSDADPQARLAGLAALLRDLGGTPPDGLREALYNPRHPLDPAALETAVMAAARQRAHR